MTRSTTNYGSVPPFAKIALTLVGIILAQGILTRYFQVFEYFDLPLIYCIYYGFTQASPGGAIAVGSVLGLLEDSLSGAPLGTNGFTKTLIAFVAASAGSKFDVDQSVTRVLALVLFTFLDGFLKILLGMANGSGIGTFDGVSLGAWTLSAAFNLLFGMILFGYRSRFSDAAA